MNLLHSIIYFTTSIPDNNDGANYVFNVYGNIFDRKYISSYKLYMDLFI